MNKEKQAAIDLPRTTWKNFLANFDENLLTWALAVANADALLRVSSR